MMYYYYCCHLYLDIYFMTQPMSIIAWESANGLGDQGSNPDQVISKTQKMVLDAFLLNTQHYKVHIKGKWSNPRKGVAPSPTPQY